MGPVHDPGSLTCTSRPSVVHLGMGGLHQTLSDLSPSRTQGKETRRLVGPGRLSTGHEEVGDRVPRGRVCGATEGSRSRVSLPRAVKDEHLRKRRGRDWTRGGTDMDEERKKVCSGNEGVETCDRTPGDTDPVGKEGGSGTG